jgi:hypothetical protein
VYSGCWVEQFTCLIHTAFATLNSEYIFVEQLNIYSIHIMLFSIAQVKIGFFDQRGRISRKCVAKSVAMPSRA